MNTNVAFLNLHIFLIYRSLVWAGWLDYWPVNPQWSRGHHRQGCPWQGVRLFFPLFMIVPSDHPPPTSSAHSRVPPLGRQSFSHSPPSSCVTEISSLYSSPLATYPQHALHISWRLPLDSCNDIKYKVFRPFSSPFPSPHFSSVSHFAPLLPCTRFPPNIWKGFAWAQNFLAVLTLW